MTGAQWLQSILKSQSHIFIYLLFQLFKLIYLSAEFIRQIPRLKYVSLQTYIQNGSKVYELRLKSESNAALEIF